MNKPFALQDESWFATSDGRVWKVTGNLHGQIEAVDQAGFRARFDKGTGLIVPTNKGRPRKDAPRIVLINGEPAPVTEKKAFGCSGEQD